MAKIIGIDLTLEMVQRAQENLKLTDCKNIEVIHVQSESIPFPDNTFDIVLSNGVFNLSPCKQELFQEIYRVLKPDGKLQFADVSLEGDLPKNIVGSLEAWSQ